MAITDIQASVLSITNQTPTANSVEDAQRFVVSSIPKEIMWSHVSETAGATSNPISVGNKTDNIVEVKRGSYAADRVDNKLRGFLDNSSSLNKATNFFPKYILDDSNTVRLFPAPDGTDEGKVVYINYSKVDDDSDLSGIVTNHVIAQCFFQLAKEMTPSAPTFKVPPSPPSAPSFGSALTISSVAPVVPITSAQSITLPTTVPNYLPPTFSPPTFSATDPTYTKPVVSPDFANANTLMTDEDTELVGSRMSVIQGQIGQYQADVGNETASFQKEQQVWANNLQEYTTKYSQYVAQYQSDIQNNLNVFQKEAKQYDAEVQESLQEAQLSDKQEDRSIQSFTAELNNYTQNIQKEVSDYQQTLTKVTQEYQSEIAKYQAELSSYQAQVAEEQTIFQTKLAKSQLYITSATQYMQHCLAEIQNYISGNSNMLNAGLIAKRTEAQQQRR